MGNWNQSFAASLLLGLALPVAAQDVTVHVYNYAGIPEEVLAEAIGHAEKVYRQAGIETQWVADPLEQGSPSSLIMRIAPESMVANWANHRTHLGYSLIPAGRRFGYIGAVYLDRIEELAHRYSHPRALVLGMVIAHELGHLLLGAQSHSLSGIMRFRLTQKSIELAGQGRLRFLPSQVKRMRKQIAERALVAVRR